MIAQESICAKSELNSAIERAENLLKRIEDCGRRQQTEILKEVIENARQVQFSIGVVGQAKRGKSTLINGLLGRRDDTLAPVNRFPATNVVSCFADGAKEEAKVLFGPDGKDSKIIPTSDIKHFACEEFNPGNQKGVKAIEVIGTFPRLGKNVVLVDTPGADNALSNLHDIVLLDFLPRLDAVNHLTTFEDEQLHKLLAAMGFTDEIERQREFDAAVTKIRPSIQSIHHAKELAVELADALGDVKGRFESRPATSRRSGNF